MTHQQNRTTSRMSRSPSKSRSRSSEKMLDSDGSMDKLTTPKFRMVTKSPSPCNRRASAVQFTTGSSPTSSGATRTNHHRSRSLRAKRNSAHIPHSLSGTQLDTKSSRSSISHSLSVPSGDEGDFHLVRNFSVTSKGIVNRGDSFRCKSRSTSLCSTPSSPASEISSFPEFTGDAPAASTSSGVPSPIPPITTMSDTKDIPKYSVWIMGSNGVGKSSIRNQFMTSEYICQYDNWRDESQNRSVTVALDGEETELDIVEYVSVDDKCRLKEPFPDAYIIVYSVTNRRSYIQARQILSKLETTFGTKAAILVGNKTDLARLRTVPTVGIVFSFPGIAMTHRDHFGVFIPCDHSNPINSSGACTHISDQVLEGRSLAKERGCKFIETSVAINHQLDELLVGIITQIRIKAKIADKHKKRSDRNSQNSRSKATCIIKRLWRRTCMTSKSCDNLHAL